MTDRPRTLLQLELTLLEQKEHFEVACVEALSVAAPALDGVLLSLPSWQEVPDATSSELVCEALARCTTDALDVYLGRDVWIRWKERAKANGWTQDKSDVFNPAYWVAFLSRIDGEAKAVGATGTFAQCEPHGDKHNTEWFKGGGFTVSEFRRVVDAINAARNAAPAATIAKPAGSMNWAHYGYGTCKVAGQHLCTKTDHLRRASDLRSNIRTPKGEQLQVHHWRTRVTSRHNANPKGKLTLPEWRAIDWAEVTRVYPEFLSCVIKAENEDMLDVLKELGEAAR